jgi:hypothetical protein
LREFPKFSLPRLPNRPKIIGAFRLEGAGAELFGNDAIISIYTRKQAIDDGVLNVEPLNDLAREYGIKFHCAMTSGLFGKIEAMLKRNRFADVKGTLWDMLTMFRCSVLRIHPLSGRLQEPNRALNPGDRFAFKFLMANRRYQVVHVVFSIEDMGGELAPCWTFMLSEED